MGINVTLLTPQIQVGDRIRMDVAAFSRFEVGTEAIITDIQPNYILVNPDSTIALRDGEYTKIIKTVVDQLEDALQDQEIWEDEPGNKDISAVQFDYNKSIESDIPHLTAHFIVARECRDKYTDSKYDIFPRHTAVSLTLDDMGDPEQYIPTYHDGEYLFGSPFGFKEYTVCSERIRHEILYNQLLSVVAEMYAREGVKFGRFCTDAEFMEDSKARTVIETFIKAWDYFILTAAR